MLFVMGRSSRHARTGEFSATVVQRRKHGSGYAGPWAALKRRRRILLCTISALAIGSASSGWAGQLPDTAFQTYDAANASTIQAGPFSLFKVPVNSVQPTQLNLGFYEVGKKITGYDLLGPTGLTKDLLTSVEPVVIGPGGVLYLTNGHHTFTSLTKSIYGSANPTVYVNVIANYSNLTTEQFWAQMQASNFLLPLDNGVIKSVDPLTGAPIPSSFAGMTNDPYRGLEYSILKNKNSVLFPNASNITGAAGASTPGLDKTAAFYSDFIWANAYRNANNGLGLAYLSPGDIAIATKWNLTGSSQTTLSGIGTVTAAQLPGYILSSNISISSAISNATLANGVLDGNGTFTGVRNQTLGSVTIGSTDPGFILQVGADKGFTVTLSGANTYTGGTTILAGTLIVNGDAALGAAAPSSYTIDPKNIAASVQAANGIIFNSLSEGDGTLQFASSATPYVINRPIAVSGETAKINVNGGGTTLTLTGQIVSLGSGGAGLGSANGESDLRKTGGGTMILAPASGSNPLFYGNWILSNGVLVASSDAALGNTSGPAYTIGQIVFNGGTFRPGASFNSVRSVSMKDNGTFDTAGFTTSFSGTLDTGSGKVLTVSNSNASTAGSVTFGSLNISGANTTTTTGTTATLALVGGAAGDTVTLTGGVSRTDRSALFITPTTAAGNTVLGVSEKVMVGAAAAPAVANGGVTNGMVNPWIVINLGGNYVSNGAAAGNNRFDFATYDPTKGYISATYNSTNIATASGTSIVEQTGNATLAANASAYALKIDSGSAVTATGFTITLGNGSNPAGLILSGSGAAITGGMLQFNGSEGVIIQRGSSTISSTIAGTNGMTLVGGTSSATLTVSSVSALSGAINVDSGVLSITAANAFTNVSSVYLSDHTAIAATGLVISANNTFASLNSAGSNSTVTISGNGTQLTIGQTANANSALNNLDSTISSTVTYAGTAGTAIIKAGTGMLDLSGGKLTLTAGSTVSVTGGTLRVSASTFTNVNNISTVAGSEVQFAQNGGGVFGGNITGSGLLHLIGGTLKLTGTGHSYSGGTVVEIGSTLSLTTANVSSGNANITNAGGLVVFDQTTGGTYSGVISDGRQMQATTGTVLSGSVVIDDSTTQGFGARTGNVTFSAQQAYTGGTFVEAGTLTLGTANAIASSSGVDLGRVGGPSGTGATSNSIVTATLALGANNTIKGLMSEAGNNTEVKLNGYALTVNTANNTIWSFGGIISDTGSTGTLTKSGSGALTLAGTSTYTGATTVNGGLLSVNGSIAASSLTTVNSGGVLGGIGTVGNTVIGSGGILAPGNSVGTMTVNGNLSFTSGSTYLVEVSPSAADRTNVTGNAALAGIVQASFESGSYTAKTYTILHAASLNGTTFGAIATNTSNFNASLSYTSTDVMLNLTAALGSGTVLSGSQQNIAGAINNFFNNGGPLPSGFQTLFNYSGAALANALNQVSGEGAANSSRAGTQATSSFLSLLLNPFAGLSGGNVSGFGPARAFAAADRELPPEVAAAYAAVTPRDTRDNFEKRWSVWGQGYGGLNNTQGDASAGTHDTRSQAYGVATGYDYRVAPNTLIGFALAGGGTSWSVSEGLGGGRGDFFQIGTYGSHSFGAAYVSGALSYTWHRMTTDRTVTVAGTDRLTASFNAQSIGGRIETGYRFAMSVLGVMPYAALQVQNFRTPSYAESAASGTGTFALTYGAQSTTSVRTELGAWFDKAFVLADGKLLTLRSRLAWAHDRSNNSATAATFQTLPGSTFTVNGAAAAPNSALVSAGAELVLKNGVSLLGRFDGEFSGQSTTYAGTGTVRVSW